MLAPVLVPRNPQQLVPSRYIYEPVPSYLIDSEKDSVSPGHYDHPLELSGMLVSLIVISYRKLYIHILNMLHATHDAGIGIVMPYALLL